MSAKLTYRTPVSKYNNTYRQRYTPELMFGLNKKWMLHLSSSFSDFYTTQLRWESVKTYVKYRFYSDDDVHRHFRMAAFAEAAYSRSPFYYGDINLDGDNSGVQAGIIATQLVNKLAVSATASLLSVFANRIVGSTLGAPVPYAWLLAAVALSMFVTTLMASLIPARRAARTDPQQALRQD